jgi:hypothetical protein
MTPQTFIAKWQKVNLSERSACQQHFLDLCELLGQPKPAEADPEGTWYTFEKGVEKTEGGKGWADVWMRDHFGWEYKGKHKNLAEAYQQLLLYREALENPPLLVVCDMDRFQVHTNFTSTAKRIYEFDLAGLAAPANLDVLRKVFTDAEALRPGITSEAITVEAADRFAKLADAMRDKGIEPLRAAHFLMKLMFCMFGEDIGLLPAGLFTRLLDDGKANPASLNRRLQTLFAAMAKGGDFGPVEIPWFNGGLFADSDVIPMTGEEIATLVNVNQYDWASIEPSIFGTLFERTLDPSKRSQIGAHYTSRNDIETLLKPVLLAPLRGEWEEVKRKCEDQLWPKLVKASRTSRVGQAKRSPTIPSRSSPQRKAFDRAILDFIERLHHVTVLDPACGSGNFLYVAIHMLLDLEKEVIAYAATRGLSLVPHVSPSQLHGLEINPYAQQLAQVVIWIGYLQWMHYNGFVTPRDPVLQPIENIRRQDAILDLSDPEHPKEPEWPEAEFIVGNPPFLGYSKLRAGLGHDYVESLFRFYEGSVSNQSDLCCYWFEKARRAIEHRRCKRAGLLATQGIRGGKNREVLKRIKKTGDIFFARSDQDWILDGANVHVSLIGFDNGEENQKELDSRIVDSINTNLTSKSDLTSAHRLAENKGIGFVGGFKFGSFDITDQEARQLLVMPNVGPYPNSQVLRPWVNGRDVLAQPRRMWIVDFGVDLPLESASLFEAPYAILLARVKPERDEMRRKRRRERWWLHGETAPNLRAAVAGLPRYLATPRVAKHRIFVWVEPHTIVDGQLIAFATSDDCFFGVLHSRIHELWALRMGTQLETRPRYTPTSCFETFPLPECVWDVGCVFTRTRNDAASAHVGQDDNAQRPSSGVRVNTHPTAEAIAAAAKELDQLRNAWLNPPEWTKTEILEFPGSVDGPWARYIDPATVRPTRRVRETHHARDDEMVRCTHPTHPAIGTVRWPRIVPKDSDCAESLKKRTLTNLYNQRPTWLAQAHEKLDAAVFAAYGWDPALPDEELLERLLHLNLERAGK